MKKIIEYLPLLSLCFIYFGFCNLNGYYKEFMVDIYQYINTTEIVMSFFPTIVVVSTSLSAIFIQEFINIPSKGNSKQNYNTPTAIEISSNPLIKRIFQSFIPWLIILLIIDFSVRSILKFYFNFKPFDFQWYNLFAFLIFIIAGLYYLKFTNRQQIIFNRPVSFVLFLVCLIGIKISDYKELDAKKIKAGFPIREITFKYNNSSISTSKSLMYIGQTSQHIFLYERISNKTFVYKTNLIDSLIILK